MSFPVNNYLQLAITLARTGIATWPVDVSYWNCPDISNRLISLAKRTSAGI